MNAPLAVQQAEVGWKTYAKGVVMILPALAVWILVQTKCLPILVNLYQHSVPPTSPVDGFSAFSILLDRFGLPLLLATGAA